MRVAVVQIWHNERMGYIDRFLPAALAALGCDVHLVTSDAKPYFQHPDYASIYEPAFGPPLAACGVERRGDGVTVHRLPHATLGKRLRICGLFGKLRDLRPSIVQGFEVNCLTSYEAALYRPLLGYRLFLESHIHASVFADARTTLSRSKRAAWLVYRAAVGRPLSWLTDRCHPISTDAADIAVRFFGMQRHKVAVAPLGTDSTLFSPATTDRQLVLREANRGKFGVNPDDVLCVYSGRMTRDKGPEILAAAIGRLQAAGEPFRGLFIGSGPTDVVRAIRSTPGCVTHPFVDVDALPDLYRAADVAVWPRQESTSQLDAAACGLPLVLSDRVQVTERVEGSGLLYREGDAENLAAQLLALRSPQIRSRLGETGRRRMSQQFDWSVLARQRLWEYERALGAGRPPEAARAGVGAAA